MQYIIGVDEVGRGPLAGPVIAAAVLWPMGQPLTAGVKDSKQLSDGKRRQLAQLLKEEAVAYAIGRAEVEEIDKMNIHHASLLAMRRAVLALPITEKERIALVMVDGAFSPEVPYPCEAVVGGDRLQPIISAASILAKVCRDDEMIECDKLYPGYGLAKHKGYATSQHQDALARLGATPIHRRSYAPVRLQLLPTQEERVLSSELE